MSEAQAHMVMRNFGLHFIDHVFVSCFIIRDEISYFFHLSNVISCGLVFDLIPQILLYMSSA